MRISTPLLTLILSASILGGCALTPPPTHYSQNQTHVLQKVQYAEVLGVRGAKIDKGTTGVGTIAGAAIGGIAASNIGGGKGSTIASILGAVAGGAIGNKLEKSSQNALELTIRLESSNEEAVIIQEDTGESFKEGDRVRLITGSRGETRVSH